MTTLAATDLDEDGAPISRLAPGDRLPGDTSALNRLGIGHRCETWLAWSPRLWCPVVVKTPRPHQQDHPRARRSLEREVAALDGNLHPGLPRLYADGSGAETPYVVFEYIDGPALDEEIDDRGAFSETEVALLAVQLLAALRTVHARGIAHVDIKPENIMLRAGRPVLLDFGSARDIGAPQPRGRLIGSPGYAAPDLEAGEPISAAMDLYGVGVTLMEALTGVVTFDPGLPAGDRPPVSHVPQPTDSAIGRFVSAMLEPDAAARPGIEDALRTLAAITEDAGHPVAPRWATG